MADPVCQFCPADERVPATRTYADPQDGYVYRLCARHYRPIGQWLEKRRRDAEPEGASA
jgi:hypothetical protein